MHDIFCKNYDIRSLTKVLTCYENPGKSSYIDLSLANRSKRFQGSSAEETGLSDFHKVTATLMKNNFDKCKPRVTLLRTVIEF